MRAADPTGEGGAVFRVTVLRARGRRLVKLFTADGRKLGTDEAASFLVERPEVRGPRELFALLARLERRRDVCLIRGAPGRWFPADGKPVFRLSGAQLAYIDNAGDGPRVLPKKVKEAEREAEIDDRLLRATMLPMFAEEPTWWALLDFEEVRFEPDWRRRLAETAAWLKLRLPGSFADASCWFQATGGAADPFKHDLGGDEVRMRLGFVLSRPLTHNQLVAWLGGVPGLDPSTLRVNQEIYLGHPIFAGGLADPMPVRSGVLEGFEDVVQVPDDLPDPAAQAWRPGEAGTDEPGTEGLGLLDCPPFETALDGIDGAAGTVRDGLGRAAWIYAMRVGPAAVDVAALAARLAEVGRRHRSAAEVEGYRLEPLIRFKLGQAARRKAEEDRQAADGAEIFASLSAGRPGEERLEPDPEPPPKPELPDFGPVEPDRDAALARLHANITAALEGAGHRCALRRDLKRRRAEARDAARAAFLRELGKDADGLNDDEKRRLRKRTDAASRAAKKAFLAEHDLTAMPPRDAILFTGGQGTGKTQAVARTLAGLPDGDVIVLVPTVKKAEELKEEIERHQPAHMFPFVWYGRTRPVPPDKRPKTSDGNLAFVDFNRRPLERMCGRPKKLIEDAQRAGVEIGRTFCAACALRLDCRYLAQLDTIKNFEGRRIVIVAHEAAFLPMPFSGEIIVVDEDIATKALRAVEIDPARLLDPDKWEGADGLEPIARKVGEAMACQGEELTALREAGVEEGHLKACIAHLRGKHEAAAEEIARAGKNGASEGRLEGMVTKLKHAELRPLAMLFANLRDELKTGRAGTNATRLVRGRRKKVQDAQGRTREERLDRYVISRPRRHGFGKDKELVLLDGTGSLELNRRLFGEDVRERRTAVPRRGLTIQVSSPSNSKYRLLFRPEAGRHRAGIRRLIADLDTLLGGSLLVGCTKELEEKLIAEGALGEQRSLHFGAERGMNSAEALAGVLVIGREQPQLPVLEDLARGLAVASPEPFVSVLDEDEQGRLPVCRRRRRMRDGSEVWGEVPGHPDRLAQALLEQKREAGIVQMADRVRAVWHDRLIVIATDVPVDLEVDLLVTQGELMAAAKAAAGGARALREHGWWLRAEPATRGGDRIRRTTAETVIESLLRKALSFGEFPVFVPSGRNLVPGRLYATLPPAEAFRRAAEAHPGLRAAPPEGGILRECLRRHGVVPAWADLPTLVPDLVPTVATAEMIKDGELAVLAALQAEFSHAKYRVPGRRGRPGVVVWDPARVADPAATLSRLLAVAVTLVERDPPLSETAVRDIMDPRSWTLPATDGPPESAPLAPATSAPAPRPGLILDDGGPPPAFRFRGQGPPSVLTVTSIFAIGRRVMVEILTRSPAASPTILELVA